MTAQTPHGPGISGCALLMMAGLVLLAPVSSSAETTPIYKCFDKNLGVLYTDEPCKDGELVNIRAGDADPAAVARVERARDALDQSVAQRVADQRYAAAQRDLAMWYASGEEPGTYDYGAPYASYDYGVAGWFPGFVRPHPPRSRMHKPPKPGRFAPHVAQHTIPRR